VETVRETGLNEDSGLQGSFRASAHQLEEFFTSMNRDDLSVEYLMLRRHEKDFLLRKNRKYINEVEASVTGLQDSVSRLPVSREQKDTAQELLTSYLEEFLALSDLTMKEKNLIDEQNKMIAEIGPILENGVKQMGIQVEKSLETAFRVRRLLLTVMFSVIGISILTALVISISIFRR
jgi:methyl-accepting chemotaxis protein